MANQDNERVQFGALSPREIDVLRYASEGLLDKEICARLGITVNTLRTYWQRIRGKIGNWTRVHLVTWYLRAELELEIETSSLKWPILRQWILTPTGLGHRSLSYQMITKGIFDTIDSCKLHPNSILKVYNAINSLIAGTESEATLENQIIVNNLTYDSRSIMHAQRNALGEISAIFGYSLDKLAVQQDLMFNNSGSWTNVFVNTPFVADRNLCSIFQVDSDFQTSPRGFLRKICKHYRRIIFDSLREANRNRLPEAKIPIAIERNGKRIELEILAIFAQTETGSNLCGGEVYDLSLEQSPKQKSVSTATA